MLVLVACAALISLALLAVWASFNPAAAWEAEVLLAFALDGGPFDPVVRAVNTIGDLPVWIALVALFAVATGYLRGTAVALLVALSLASDLAAFGVKLLVGRERPETAAVEQILGLDSFAFPSGHVVRAVALVAIAAFIFAPPRWRLPIALVASVVAGLVMGYARVAAGVHWPTDALGGFLLGVGWFALMALFVSRRG